MKITNLDSFYAMIDSKVQLVGSYTEKKYAPTIIKMCRLKPHTIIYGKTRTYSKIALYKWWVDEFGNSFKVIKNKRLDIVLNDPDLRGKRIICTDLYACLPFEKILRITKLLYFNIYKKTVYFASIGLDGYLRCFKMRNGIVEQISPLEMEMKRLIKIVEYSDIKYYKKIKNKYTDEWVSFWPPHPDFFEAIKEYDWVDILKITKGEK